MEAVGGGELVVLLEEDLVGCGVGHGDGMVWGEVPLDGVEGWGKDFL